MKKFDELMIQPEPWEGLMMGNHALARAMFEAGVNVVTTYPGSPTPEIADAILSVPVNKRPLHFEYATNEKVATEIAFGSSINGHLSVVFFKSVGLNVASDSAVQLGLMNMVGGLVIILGDDPGANSSQNEQDNRHFARMAYIPTFEPATPTEAYKAFKEAAELSKKYQIPVILRMTTHVCHAKEIIKFGKINTDKYKFKPIFNVKNGPFLPITKSVFPLKRKAIARIANMEKEAESSVFNIVHSPFGSEEINGKRFGVITSSMPVLSLLENLDEAKKPVDILALNFSYPWPKNKVKEFLDSHDEVIIIEELDRIMESEIKSFAYDEEIKCNIHSRSDSEDLMGELGPERTWKILSEIWPDYFPAKEAVKAAVKTEEFTNPRIPQMCPGCGHRSAFHAIKQALPKDAITVGDIGCHSLGFFKPYNMGEMLLSMGHSSGTAAGLSIGNDKRKILAFIGDSTFFHAGLPAIINAVLYDHDFTLVIMENGTTAMTGHQPHAGSGEIGDKISIDKILEALGVKFIRRVDTYQQKKLTDYVKEAFEHKGFAVVIASHPCMLKFMRGQRKKESYVPKHVHIDPNKCKNHNVCVEDFACPSFIKNDDGKITVNKDLCIGDGSCKQTCPVTAIDFEKGEI
ncbi:MAG: thiamine pyrophosphate-dependent enzyme [Candidatus Delongbacteria bacterium]|jgi:indolepyruvate ferredoxin oxidoreductase alpha subunit|nr:thiamine pyrophosphate-dependent enzyme [Candidatus Delongbacteria bacterium]